MTSRGGADTRHDRPGLRWLMSGGGSAPVTAATTRRVAGPPDWRQSAAEDTAGCRTWRGRVTVSCPIETRAARRRGECAGCHRHLRRARCRDSLDSEACLRARIGSWPQAGIRVVAAPFRCPRRDGATSAPCADRGGARFPGDARPAADVDLRQRWPGPAGPAPALAGAAGAGTGHAGATGHATRAPRGTQRTRAACRGAAAIAGGGAGHGACRPTTGIHGPGRHRGDSCHASRAARRGRPGAGDNLSPSVYADPAPPRCSVCRTDGCERGRAAVAGCRPTGRADRHRHAWRTGARLGGAAGGVGSCVGTGHGDRQDGQSCRQRTGSGPGAAVRRA